MFASLMEKVKTYLTDADLALIRRAFEFSKEAHRDQLRRSGDAFVTHPLTTARMLADLHLDAVALAAALLHDVPEDTDRTLEDIEKNFGTEVANLVEGITKLSKIKYRGVERYVESLRKMFLAMASDLRVVLIKFADRLHNLRTLDALPPEKQKRIAQETMEIYAPIAGLLGIARLKWQMEDLCFKYLYPESYKKLEYEYEVEKKLERHKYIEKVKKILSRKLKEARISHEITGRFKHLYSIYKKMQTKDRRFDEIYDVFALRVVVPTVTDCYKTLGVIHSLWKPKMVRFKDYIAVPKPNGYRSIHTTVFGPEGKATEFQIRTREMHEEALYGIAAHWHYKEKSNKDQAKQPRWIKEVLDLQRQATDSSEFIHRVKFDAVLHRIFVFTPKGDVYDLPDGSTPVDFAYAVHTDIGNHYMAARVNDKIAPMETRLKNGDLVEIVIDKKRSGPSRDWLKFVKTQKARNKIRQFAPASAFESIKKFIPKLK